MVFLALTELFWGTGAYLTLVTTTVPAYLRALGASQLVIGVMATGMLALPLLPQFFGRSVLDRFPRRKRAIIGIHLLVIAPYFLLPLADGLLAANRPLLITTVIVLLALSQTIIGLVIPVWVDMVGNVIPQPLHGRYFGLSAACAAGGGILGGVLLMQLQRVLGAGAYRIAFFGTGCFYLLAMCAFALAPIPESALAHPPGPSVWSRLRDTIRACHPRTDFGRLVGSFMAQSLASAVIPFLIVFALDPAGLRYPPSVVGQMTIWQAVGGLTLSFVLGGLVDRVGPRLPWVAVTTFIPIALVLALHGAVYPALAAAAVLIGVNGTSWSVTGPAILSLSPEGDKSGYIAIANMAGFLPAAIGPLLIAQVIATRGYAAGFTLAGAAGVVAIGLALTVHEKRAVVGEDGAGV